MLQKHLQVVGIVKCRGVSRLLAKQRQVCRDRCSVFVYMHVGKHVSKYVSKVCGCVFNLEKGLFLFQVLADERRHVVRV